MVAFTTWLPSFFQRFGGVSIQQSGMMAAGAMIVSVIAFPIAGYLTDLWWKKLPSARMLVPMIGAITGAVLVFVALQLHGGAQFAAFVCALG